MSVSLTVLRGGASWTPEGAVVPGAGWRRTEIPALFALIEHPSEGVLLFDTGYHTRMEEATARWPFRLFRYTIPLRMSSPENAVAQLAARGVPAEAVRWIVLSHFDPDHVGGLRDFPAARVITTREAWEAVAGKTGWAAMRAKVIPALLPEDLPDRLRLVSFDGPALGPFERSHDLFGDGALRLVPLPGHAAGQSGLLLSPSPEAPVLLAADGCWSRAALRQRGKGLHLRLAQNRRAQRDTYARLQAASTTHGWRLVPAHCPEAAAEWVRPPSPDASGSAS